MESTFNSVNRSDGRWEFRKSAEGRWWWRVVSAVGEEAARSDVAFPDMTECIADAQRHGYRGA